MAGAQDKSDRGQEVLRILVENKLISSAQADLALADMEIMSMGIDEVLLARRWVSEEKLYECVPWLKEKRPAAGDPAVSAATNSGQPDGAGDPAGTENATFEENLQKYRELMDKMLGDANS